MSGKKRMSNRVARIENKFVFNAQYKLGLREQKVLLYLIANIDTQKDFFEECIIPIKELESILKSDGKKWGNAYDELKKLCSNMSRQQITFITDIYINGKVMPGYLNWFQSVAPVRNEGDEVCIRFLFSSDLKPFLLQLQEYARINRLEVANMRSAYSIRLFQICKAAREKQRKYKELVTVTYSVEELKKILGIEDKYSEYKDFRKYVIKKALKEINKQTSVHVEVESIRNSRRRIEKLRFLICDSDKKEVLTPKQLKQAVDSKKDEDTSSKRTKPKKYFNYEEFQESYPIIYEQIREEVRRKYMTFEHRDKIPNLSERIHEGVVASCKEYFYQHIAPKPNRQNNMQDMSSVISKIIKN